MDRRTKRHIEKENLRERAAGRREYNECVRVGFSSNFCLSLLAVY